MTHSEYKIYCIKMNIEYKIYCILPEKSKNIPWIEIIDIVAKNELEAIKKTKKIIFEKYLLKDCKIDKIYMRVY